MNENEEGVKDASAPAVELPSDKQVEAYLRSKFAELQTLHDYASISISLYGSPAVRRATRYSVDFGTAGSMSEGSSLTEAIAKVGGIYSAEKEAADLRKEIDRLREKAEKLERGEG